MPAVLAIVGWDFIYYWNHRFMHEVRALWAHHVVHHSSERYNLSTALRQPVADVLGVYLPYGLMARVGIRPALIEQARGVNLLYQYWIHTDAIRSLGAGEEVLNTPSHHRVHHGSNGQYLDRNHGSILIVWDRLFGTFQREDEAVVYGLTKNIDTYNPVRIASHEFADIVRDVAHSTTWRDRLSFVLRGPGWAYRRHAERAARRRQLTTSVQLSTACGRASQTLSEGGEDAADLGPEVVAVGAGQRGDVLAVPAVARRQRAGRRGRGPGAPRRPTPGRRRTGTTGGRRRPGCGRGAGWTGSGRRSSARACRRGCTRTCPGSAARRSSPTARAPGGRRWRPGAAS